MTSLLITEWIATIMGLAGSYMLAFNTRISKYGWFAFLIANVAMLLFSIEGKHYGLFCQSIGFFVSSLIGIYRNFLQQPIFKS